MIKPGLKWRSREVGNNRLRLRTLILLRWLAITGQVGTVMVSDFSLGLDLPYGLCVLTIGASVIVNLIFMSVFPANRLLSDTESTLMLLFDLSQLSFLIYLAGGISNPFALLIITPVIIAASSLQLRSTIVTGAVAICLLTLVSLNSFGLHFRDGTDLSLPPLFAFGFWLSIVIGILFLGLYSYRVTSEIQTMSDALLATQMALAREQRLTNLSSVIAATAHELNTPLSTIKLTSAELMEDMDKNSPLQEDVRLIHDQAGRCHEILRSMGRAGKEDLHLRRAPLCDVLHEAAEPHKERGKDLIFDLEATKGQPHIVRRPEIIHGLRNLIQNAVDFAESTVWIDVGWWSDQVRLTITDDGDGYPLGLLSHLGDPFLQRRHLERQASKRPGYEGMGLGIFIAKTLLERSGAELAFSNASGDDSQRPDGSSRNGAVVEIRWPADRIISDAPGSLGPNTLIVE